MKGTMPKKKKKVSKSLKSKAIDIKGKKYVLVSDRIVYFNKEYPSGYIVTKLLSQPDADMVMVKAKIVPNVEVPERYFTGLSQAVWGDGMVNKTSALENAETSAVGRALAMMGIGVIDSVASADEMTKAGADKDDGGFLTAKQESVITKMIRQGHLPPTVGKEINKMTKTRASELIKAGLANYQEAQGES